jgi:hypothetical protein
MTIVVGLICLRLGYIAVLRAFVIATSLGSAAALLIGSANIQPAHLLLVFVVAGVFSNSRLRIATASALNYPKPGFWFMWLVIVGVVSAFLMPRLLADSMAIYPLGASEYAPTGSTVPLGPVSSNLTQSIYLTGDLVCLAVVIGVASVRGGLTAVTNAVLACAVANVVFAFLDLATYFTNTQWLLDFIRNAQYVLHVEEEVVGLKRIVGAFPEASSFSQHTLGLFGFVGTLWAFGYRPAMTGILALSLVVLLVFSTSSSGLAGTPPALIIIYFTAFRRFGIGPTHPYRSAALLCAPLAIVAVLLAAQFDPEVSRPVRDYLDELIFNKATTASGIERNEQNRNAMENFYDSFGLGVGLGTVRTSSFPVALLSNVGVPGTALYILFAVTAFGFRRGVPGTVQANIRSAARNGCLCSIVGWTISGPTVDQSLLFYILAGLVCAEPERTDEHRRQALQGGVTT